MDRRAHRQRRPVLSCLECRRRKIKCSRTEPCAQCVSSNHSQCVYSLQGNAPVIQEESRQQSNVLTLDSTLDQALERLLAPVSQEVQGISDGKSDIDYDVHNRRSTSEATVELANHSTPMVAKAPNVSQAHTKPDERAYNAEHTLQGLLTRLRVAGEPSVSNSILGLTATNRAILNHQSGLQDSQTILNKSRILSWSHWMSTSQEFKSLMACYAEVTGKGDGTSYQDAESRSLVVEIGTLLKTCKSLATSIKMARPGRGSLCPEFGLTLPPRDVSDAMINLYFGSFESTYRILHVPTFKVEYERYWDQPDAITTEVRLLICLVIGIGSSLYVNTDIRAEIRDMVHQWIYDAQMWLSGPLKKNRLGIRGLQIYCLTILAREIFSIGGDLVWMSMGSLMHQAMQIGLHRDPRHLPVMSSLQAELRRRLWATILEMSIQSSMDAAMPPRISLDEFDTEAPSNVNDEELDDTTTAIQPHPKGICTNTSLQIILYQSLATRLRIAQLLNNLRSELSYVDVLSLSSSMSNAIRASGHFTEANRVSGVTSFHRNLLNYALHRSLIPLHCPFAFQARTNPLYQYSLKSSLDAAMLILSPEPDEPFTCLMSTGGGLFREGIREAGSVISVELLAQTNAQRLHGTLHNHTKPRDALKEYLRDMISLSLQRIQQGETNIKSHTFLSMILAQVEAIEANAPCEVNIARSARDSLQLCYDQLQLWFTRVSFASSRDVDLTSVNPYDEEDLFGLDFDMDLFPLDVTFT